MLALLVWILTHMAILVFSKSTSFNSTKPKAFVHIGPHKTATTYLQSQIVNRFNKQLKKYNFYWPDVTGKGRKAKEISKFSYYLKSKKADELVYGEAMVSYLQNASGTKSNVILSAEDFSNLDVSSIELLKHALLGFDVTIVMTYRIFAARILSFFNQVAKTGNLYSHEQIECVLSL